MIAPNVVLTAAHCADRAAFQGHDIESFTVFTDWNLTDGVAEAGKVAP